ncbi:heterokaryon incompatibility protein-domain-containing protein, partial [Lasiosphaeris hirsuta]
RFSLLRAWLQQCDAHTCCQRPRALEGNFPTRVLDIGNPDALRLVSNQEVFSQKVSSRRYIALSHCWGKLAPGKIPQHCTTTQNIDSRKEGRGFCVGSLPLTFQDAIKVSQGLDIRYLWIDSLCIIQGSGGDWATESGRMEAVYAGAYCTIAATSAVSSEAGFLGRDEDETHRDNQNVPRYVSDNESPNSQAYLHTRAVNFAQEVDNGPLNQRAWVLQERYLSRRTVHFSSYRMYFECGFGIYGEDYTQMKSIVGSEKFIDLDPNFPSRLGSDYFNNVIKFLQSLFETYSTRELSVPADRAVALSGLLARIGSVFECKQSYGILEKFLHRTLIWHWTIPRKENTVDENSEVPSWSWMRYKGGIQFHQIRYGEWDKFRNLQFTRDGRALVTNVWEFRNCRLQKDLGADSTGIRHQILDSSGELRGCVMYDVEDYSTLCLEWAIILGAKHESQDLYLLVVRRTAGGEYERLGTGMIHRNYVLRKDGDAIFV